jgi:hypothetical protein
MWFLCAGNVASVTRSISVPPDQFVFIPVTAVACSTNELPPFHGDDEEGLRACAQKWSWSDVRCEIDGVPVENIENYHVTSPLFSLIVPANNFAGVPAGPFLGMGDGHAVILQPLSPGPHTIHFHNLNIDFNDTTDVTYNITVITRPAISIRSLPSTNLIELSWPSTEGFLLQETASSAPGATWTAASVVSTSFISGIQSATVTSTVSTNRFFRLFRP